MNDDDIIGYVSLNREGQPYRSPRSGYGHYTAEQKGKNPPKIYSTQRKAESYSPVRQAAIVRMEKCTN